MLPGRSALAHRIAGSNVIVVKLASDLNPSPPTPDAGPLGLSPTAADAIARWAHEGRRLRQLARLLPAITAVAATLILAAVALRLWLADVRRGEVLVSGGGTPAVASHSLL